MNNRVLIAVILSGCVLAGCANTGDYYRQQEQAAIELPAYEQAFKDADCFNLRFKFENGMQFGQQDALDSLKCLEIERNRNELRGHVTGMHQYDEVVAYHGYDTYRAIFSFLANGEISLGKAREAFSYASEKFNLDATTEINRSNQLLAQGLENDRRYWEQANRDRAIFYQNVMQQSATRSPIVTTCNVNAVMHIVVCTTQ